MKKLKMGLLVDSEYVSTWEYAMLERIQNSGYAQIDLIVSQIFPNWEKNVRAANTLNFDENLTVIDALIKK